MGPSPPARRGVAGGVERTDIVKAHGLMDPGRVPLDRPRWEGSGSLHLTQLGSEPRIAATQVAVLAATAVAPTKAGNPPPAT